MQRLKNYWWLLLVVLAFGVAAIGFWREHSSAPFPSTPDQIEASSTANFQEASPENAAAAKPPVFTLDPRDTISSWNFAASDAAGQTKAQAAIASLASADAAKQYSAYERYESIALAYDALGDGKNEYAYLLKALAQGGNGSAVWDNLGALLERLGAYYSARTAYANAVAAAPTVGTYREAEVRLLVQHFPQNTVAIEGAFAVGVAVDPNLYPDEANWLTSIGSTTAAVTAWRAFEKYVPAAQQSAIEAQITTLEAKK